MPTGESRRVGRSDSSRQTIADCGEHGFLQHLLPRLRKGSHVVVGPGQDCALVRARDHRLLITVDALVEGVHFETDWMSPKQLGRRCFLVNLSDIAAMGGRPRWCVVSITTPASYPRRSLARLHAGIDAAAAESGACIVGGNFARSRVLSISVTLIGEAPVRAVTRRGASPGDMIFVTGTLGDAALGVRYLRQGINRGHVVRRYREPIARLQAGRILVDSGVASAMIDISDGLVQDLRHICTQSGVGAVIESASLPVSRAYRDKEGDDPRLALRGGEDYELLCTVPEAKMGRLRKLMPRLGCPLTKVGTVTRGRRLRVMDCNGTDMDLPTGGYDHFVRI